MFQIFPIYECVFKLQSTTKIIVLQKMITFKICFEKIHIHSKSCGKPCEL